MQKVVKSDNLLKGKLCNLLHLIGQMLFRNNIKMNAKNLGKILMNLITPD